MSEPVVIGRGKFQGVDFSAGGSVITRIVYPQTVGSINVFCGLGEADPGRSPHRWHTHTKDSAPEVDIVYPEGFEEYYHILQGNGTLQWKAEDGTVREEPVGEGDTIYFPPDIAEHQLLNTGERRLVLFYGGAPPAKLVSK